MFCRLIACVLALVWLCVAGLARAESGQPSSQARLDDHPKPDLVLSFNGAPEAVDTNSVTADYTIRPDDCGKTIQAGTGSSGLFTVFLPATAKFSPGCRVAL